MGPPPRRQRGLTLTELMVSVAISVAVLSSLVYVYVGSRAAYRSNEALARVQEAGRFALEWIARDLRQAGYVGCLSREPAITFYSNPKPTVVPTAVGVFGHENGQGFVNPTTIARVRGDVLLVSSIDARSRTYLSENSDVGSASLRVPDNCAKFRVNDFVAVGDCGRAAVVTLTALGNDRCGSGSGATTLTHGSAKNGGADTSGHEVSPAFLTGRRAFVARFPGAPTGYFIGNNRAGRPSLYRFTADQTEEVVENIEDIDVLFGIDADADGAADAYLTAAEVTAAGQWNRVLSVRVSLVVVGAERESSAPAQVIFLRDNDGDGVVDAQAAPNDGRLRQVFSTTVALRNRLQ